MPIPGTELVSKPSYGEYRVEARVSEDPAGTVFGAYDETKHRLVSLRVFSPFLTKSSGFVDFLRIQLQAVSTIRDPGIVPVFGTGEQDGQFYVASEWCPGGSLAQAIAQSGALDFPVALGIVSKCAGTLKAVSQAGFFHGNLRPGNLQFHTDAGIKVSELGLAAAIRATFGPKDVAVYLGSAKFLPPEMSEKSAPDLRADIYSLGVIFYYMIFGVVPFRHYGQRLQDTLPDLDAAPSREVLEVLSRMTEVNPKDRYSDYDSLLNDLKSLKGVPAPPIEKPPARKEPETPSIRNQDLFPLLCALYTSGTSGLLNLRGEGAEKTFHIRSREIVFFESTRRDEDIWNWLVKKRELNEEDVPEERENLHFALQEVLDRDLIRMEDFRYRYQEVMQQSLSEVLRWQQINAYFKDGWTENEPPATLPLGDFLMKAAKRFADSSRIRNEVQIDSLMSRTSLFDSLIAGLPLSTEESLFISHSHRDNHVRSIQTASKMSEDRVLRFLYLLRQIGAVNLSAARPGGWASDSATAPDQDPGTVTQPLQLQKGRDHSEPSPSESFRDHNYLQSVRVEVHHAPQGTYREHYANESAKYFELARKSYDEENYGSAAHYCEKAIGINEESSYYWLMGLSYSHHPKFRKKAEDCFHRAIDLDPLNDDLHIQLAEFYISRGLLLRAKSHCIKALEIVPGEARAKELYMDIDKKEPGIGGCWCEHAPGCTHTGKEGHHVCKK